MSNFTEIVTCKLRKTVESRSMLQNVDKIVVGFSGGADSVCLLHLLHKLQSQYSYELLAVHVNHGIRGEEAKKDASFAEQFCSTRSIPFKLVEIDCVKLAEEEKQTLEEAGRMARYSAFEKYCTDLSKIATAHNQNDNAETLLFNLARGTSLKGACGIPYVRNNVIRPLLDCSRKEIEGYCKENNLLFVTDSTNLSDDYTRNKIRHNVLPVFSDLNEVYLDKITAFCNDCEEAVSFLEKHSELHLEKATLGKNCYDARCILNLEKAVATRVLISSFKKFSTITLDRFQISSLFNLLDKGGRLQIKGDVFAEVKQGKLRYFLMNSSTDSSEALTLFLPFDVAFNGYNISTEFIDCSKNINGISSDNIIDCDKLKGNLVLRSRCAGDKITLKKRNVTKSLKKLFCEENIPLEIRDSVPVLSDDNGIVWVYGFGVDKRLSVTSDSVNIIYVRGKYNDR